MIKKEYSLRNRKNSLQNPTKLILVLSILILSCLVSCSSPSSSGNKPAPEELETVDYKPVPGDDWEVSTPAEQDLDPLLVAELYHNAAELKANLERLVNNALR